MTETLVQSRRPWHECPPEEQRERQQRAEASRQVRAFKKTIAPAAEKIWRAVIDERLQRLITDYAFKKNTGRDRALARLQKHLAPVTLCPGDGGVVTWSWLEPSNSVLISDNPSLTQDCIVVNFGIGGRQSTQQAGLHVVLSLEVPDHALGRLLQRSPNTDIAAALIEAHEEFLQADAEAVLERMKKDREFYLRGGAGVFICEGIAATSNGQRYFYARSSTWISDVMIRPDQKPLPRAGADDEPMLNVLLAMTTMQEDV